jgi:hypothetical protein
MHPRKLEKEHYWRPYPSHLTLIPLVSLGTHLQIFQLHTYPSTKEYNSCGDNWCNFLLLVFTRIRSSLTHRSEVTNTTWKVCHLRGFCYLGIFNEMHISVIHQQHIDVHLVWGLVLQWFLELAWLCSHLICDNLPSKISWVVFQFSKCIIMYRDILDSKGH